MSEIHYNGFVLREMEWTAIERLHDALNAADDIAGIDGPGFVAAVEAAKAKVLHVAARRQQKLRDDR